MKSVTDLESEEGAYPPREGGTPNHSEIHIVFYACVSNGTDFLIWIYKIFYLIICLYL